MADRRDAERGRPAPGAGAAGREERLAAAMRANLRRRKEQSRARDGAARPAGEPGPGEEGEVEGPAGRA